MKKIFAILVAIFMALAMVGYVIIVVHTNQDIVSQIHWWSPEVTVLAIALAVVIFVIGLVLGMPSLKAAYRNRPLEDEPVEETVKKDIDAKVRPVEATFDINLD